MAEIKLAPCPFCGEEAEWFYLIPNGAWVGCKDADSDSTDNPKCLIRPSIRRYRGDKEKSLEVAISDWNKRPSNWHTGTPTEEGWYLVKCNKYSVSKYNTDYFRKEQRWVFGFQESYVAWQKIEEGDK